MRSHPPSETQGSSLGERRYHRIVKEEGSSPAYGNIKVSVEEGENYRPIEKWLGSVVNIGGRKEYGQRRKMRKETLNRRVGVGGKEARTSSS